MKSDIQVLGLCRFSYPAPIDSFQTRHKSIEERRAALYAPKRLELRCFWFEHIALPGIKAQTDQDFTFFMLFGADFPEPYKSRMLNLVADVPQIKPLFRETAPHRDVYRDILVSARDPYAQTVAEFRLDDDDAVARDYVEQIRNRYQGIKQLQKGSGRVAMDFCRGMIVEGSPYGVSFIPVLTRFWAAGLTLFFDPDDKKSVMDFPHQQVWKQMPAVSFNYNVMYLRGWHSTNDSNIRAKSLKTLDFSEERINEILKDKFAISKERFEQGVLPLC